MADGRAEVAIVGAGLSGLVAARRLEAAGITDLVVLEARERLGGRLTDLTRPGGGRLELGGEFTGPAQPRLGALAAEFGIEAVPLPGTAAAAAGGVTVRLHAGRRHLESTPFAAEPDAARVYLEAVGALDALAATIPAAAPWEAPGARALDARSLGEWLDANVLSAPVRADLATVFSPLGASPQELSLLFALWTISSSGGFAAHEQENVARFVPGTSELVRRLAAELSAPIVTAAPVRTLRREAGGVRLSGEGGETTARVAVLAIAPTQCAKVEFSPPLPARRDRAQDRWLAGHGGKVFAVYAEPWWRAEGLAGLGSGDPLLPFALDVSPADDSEGILCGLVCATGENVAELGDVLDDPVAFRVAALEALVAYFGPAAAHPRELHHRLWQGERWSDGCGTGLPPGVLSSCGPALRAAVGPIVWAGAESGVREHMEGAVEAGERAAAEVLELL